MMQLQRHQQTEGQTKAQVAIQAGYAKKSKVDSVSSVIGDRSTMNEAEKKKALVQIIKEEYPDFKKLSPQRQQEIVDILKSQITSRLAHNLTKSKIKEVDTGQTAQWQREAQEAELIASRLRLEIAREETRLAERREDQAYRNRRDQEQTAAQEKARREDQEQAAAQEKARRDQLALISGVLDQVGEVTQAVKDGQADLLTAMSDAEKARDQARQMDLKNSADQKQKQQQERDKDRKKTEETNRMRLQELEKLIREGHDEAKQYAKDAAGQVAFVQSKLDDARKHREEISAIRKKEMDVLKGLIADGQGAASKEAKEQAVAATARLQKLQQDIQYDLKLAADDARKHREALAAKGVQDIKSETDRLAGLAEKGFSDAQKDRAYHGKNISTQLSAVHMDLINRLNELKQPLNNNLEFSVEPDENSQYNIVIKNPNSVSYTIKVIQIRNSIGSATRRSMLPGDSDGRGIRVTAEQWKHSISGADSGTMDKMTIIEGGRELDVIIEFESNNRISVTYPDGKTRTVDLS